MLGRPRTLRPDSWGIGTSPAYDASASGPEQRVKLRVPTSSQDAVARPIPGALVRHASVSAQTRPLRARAISASSAAIRARATLAVVANRLVER